MALATSGCSSSKPVASTPASPPPYGAPASDLSKAAHKPDPLTTQPLDSGRSFESVEDARLALQADQKDLEAAIGDGAVSLSADSAGCTRACRALVSMRRSVDGVCELAGEEDSFCEEARATLSKSEQRVEAAGCGC